jgi:hypothetical protein
MVSYIRAVLSILILWQPAAATIVSGQAGPERKAGKAGEAKRRSRATRLLIFRDNDAFFPRQ